MRPSKRHRLEKKRSELEWRRRRRQDPLLARRLIDGQRPRVAMFAGGAVAVAGAMVWVIVALSTSFPVQLLAIAIGAGCGYAVGHQGRAVDPRFARMSAYLCIVSCACGELLVAYALRLDLRLLYGASSLGQLIVFVLVGAATAHLCTFAWLTRDQKQALWNERHKRDEDPSGTSGG